MLHLNRKDVAQVDLGDVLPMFQPVFKDFVASTVSKMFHLFLDDVAIILIWVFHTLRPNVAIILLKCFSCFSLILQQLLQVFLFERCFICFTPMLQ